TMTDANVINASRSIITMADANATDANGSIIITMDANVINANRIIRTTTVATHADPIRAAATPTRAAASPGTYGVTKILIRGSSRSRKSRISITRQATVKPDSVRSVHSQPAAALPLSAQ
ncbi:hypothetical protein, partial [Paenibacillus dendritiformis]|uniref:hypothetical protein n=1 Tax=Paenibacillus dendritiformis TaxID=130049 RepID=UPI001300C11C